MAIAKTRNITDSVKPMVAMAFTLTFETKKISTIANRDSMTISKIIGMESIKMALLMDPEVKFFSLPVIATFKFLKNVRIGLSLICLKKI
jgi:hypothetical protein